MIFRESKAVLLAICFAFLAATAAPAQNAAAQGASQDSTADSVKPSKQTDKVKLLDVTRISTEDAARRAAQEKSEKKTEGNSAKEENSKKNASSGVSELRPVTKAPGDSTDTVQISTKKSGKLPVKDVHGSVQGVNGSGVRETGAAVGASSKGGKVHVYVETERSRTDTQPPQ